MAATSEKQKFKARCEVLGLLRSPTTYDKFAFLQAFVLTSVQVFVGRSCMLVIPSDSLGL